MPPGASGYLQKRLKHHGIESTPLTRYNQNRKSGATGPDQFHLPYGLGSGGGPHALALQRYLSQYGATREELFEVVNADRRHAQLNPWAYWKGKERNIN